ncbi:hypothetical protein [Acinetobacter lwoffii]|uniref:hypothetical protein n=1 Tax=Acinetobacter lwoffii TaxID=28090 RepID=UPI0030D13AD2
MDIQKENNLIQEAFEVEADEVGFCLDQKWGDYENPYESSDTALAFNLFKKGWQAKAQAVPEGFILVPKEPTEAMIQRGTKANSECLNENAPLGERLFRHPTLQVYQAMVNGSGE